MLQGAEDAEGADGMKEVLAGIKRRRTAALKDLADASAKRDKKVRLHSMSMVPMMACTSGHACGVAEGNAAVARCCC